MKKLRNEKELESMEVEYFDRADKEFRRLNEKEENLLWECKDIKISKNENVIIWRELNKLVNKRVDNRSFVPEWKKKIAIGNKYSNYFGGYSDNYKDGYTLEEFYTSIVNQEKYKSANSVLTEIVRNVRKEFNSQGIDNKMSRVRAMVLHHTIYTKWIGFQFESAIKFLMELNGMEVLETTEYMDKTYKIDIVGKTLEGKKIGIQCKSFTFLKNRKEGFAKYIQENISGQKLAILSGEIDEVYYIFHDEESNIVPILERDGGFSKGDVKCLISVDSITESYELRPAKGNDAYEIFKEEINKLQRKNLQRFDDVICYNSKIDGREVYNF